MEFINKQNIPNIITITRSILIIPVLYTLLLEEYRIAFFIFIIAGVSDGLDGYLARRYGWSSKFGAFADPLADKLLMITTYFTLAYLEQLPLWLVLLVIGRDILLMTGVVIYSSFIEKVEYGASLLSKANTLLQLFLVVLILFTEAFPAFKNYIVLNIITVLIYVVAITTICSLLNYVCFWGKKAWGIKHKHV